MSGLGGRLQSLSRRRIAFTIVVLLLLGVFVLFTGILLLGPVLLFFPDALGVNPDIGPHRFHAMAISLVTWTVIIGLLAQLRTPRSNVAGHGLALLNFVTLGLAFGLTGYDESLVPFMVLGGLMLLATVLHPARHEFLDSFNRRRTNLLLLVLVFVAAAPLLAYAATQVGLQTGSVDQPHVHGAAGHSQEVHEEHVENGHFVNTAALTFIVIGAGLIASLQPDGWWLPAWFAGIVPLLLGLLSLLYPQPSSAFGPLWSGAAVAWGLAFIAAAEYTQTADAPTLLGRLGFVPVGS